MLMAEKQLAQEINALMREDEILDAKANRRYGKNNRGSDLRRTCVAARSV